jgi:hypothetical protein
MDNQQVIDIYAREGIEISEQEAAQDIAHAMQDNPDYFKMVNRIEGYAKQRAQEEYADACEAREHQANYE